MANRLRDGDGGGFTGTSPGGFQTVSPLAIPELMSLFEQIRGGVPSTSDLDPIFQQILQSIPGQTRSFEDIVAQGAGSPLFQQILQPALEALAPSEDLAREALTDRFRAAGGLRSGAYGVAAPRLEQNILGKRESLISQVLSQMLQPLISGSLEAQKNAFLPARSLTELLQQRIASERNRFLPSSALIDLFQAARPQVNFNQPQQQFPQPDSQRLFDRLFGGQSAEDRVRQQEQDFLSSPFLGGSFADGATTRPSTSTTTQVSQPRQLDQFVNPNIFADPFAGVTTGSLNNFYQNPFTGGYSNFPSDIENLPFFDFGSGAFEY